VLQEADEAGSFAARLRRLRERAGLTQEELAERAGLTVHAVSALERGTRTRPYPHTVRSLAAALEITAAQQDELVAAVPSRRSSRPAPSAPAPVTAAAAPVVPPLEPPAAAPARPATLVVPPTPLFGRDGDLAALASVIRSGRCRLLTLTGMGGVGKTRLAAALAAELAPDFPDGQVTVALASVSDASDVLDTIGRALGLTGGDAPGAVDLVSAQIGDRRLLLVLDNFEHLLDAAAAVGELAARCPGLTVLVSSRAPLRVRGEHEYPVGPLALPAPEASTVDELAAAPSGALVLDRARAVSPLLELTPDTVRALAQLCLRLAGIPLAIELATARLRLLTPASLLGRLDDVLDSASSARDLPPRQRTMRATLDWSHGLLSPGQQTLFTVLGVFRGGATLEAVEQVVAASTDLPASAVLELLESLVEQSMVVVRTGVDGQRRYAMLEPVAQYAQGLLTGELARAAAAAHAVFYLALAKQAAAGYERDDQVLWLARTEADEANMMAVVDRGVQGGDPDYGGRIVWKLWLYWWLRGQPTTGRRRAEQCLGSPLSPAVLVRVNLTAACMAYAGGDMAAAGRHWALALEMGEAQQDAEVICKSLAGTGLAALAAGELDQAGDRFRRSLPWCAAAGEAGVWMSALVHVWLGTVVLLQGEPAGAVAEVGRGLEIARRRGDRLSTYVALYNLAQVALAAGDHARAQAHLEEGIVLSEQTSDIANLAYFLDLLAVVESGARGPAERVAVLIGAAQVLRATVGTEVYAYYVPDLALHAAVERGARETLGEQGFDEALRRGRALDLTGAVAFALHR
jgi:predicted ATPase/transcriptional regulator with XRE-family HTH domain